MNCRNLNLERQTEILKINIMQCKNQFDTVCEHFFVILLITVLILIYLRKGSITLPFSANLGVLELAKTERIKEINGFDILKSKIISNSKFYFLKKYNLIFCQIIFQYQSDLI